MACSLRLLAPLDGDRAFAIPRRYSQDTNTKLRDVAEHLIETRKLPR